MTNHQARTLSVLGTALGAGAVGYLLPLLQTSGVPTSAHQWECAGIVALLSGLGNVLHLLQTWETTPADGK
jgi:hypothetical protein